MIVRLRRGVEPMHQKARRQSELHALRRPQNGRLYLISSLSPQQVARRYRWWSAAHLVIFFGAMTGMASALRMLQ